MGVRGVELSAPYISPSGQEEGQEIELKSAVANGLINLACVMETP